MEIEVTPRQKAFLDATADEVLFGGAAGGGKSYGQIVDALLFALQYPGSKQLILRRTLPELEKSLVRTALALYPAEWFEYRKSSHVGCFKNGSLIDFGYLDHENDVYKYQSAEYDIIRFDELTHFTEQMYVYLLSRCRGANGYPKQIKSSTNPGGIGHGWVKSRFIDIGPPDTVYRFSSGSRLFLPSKVQDNLFLMKEDPGYVKRLENLSEKDRAALLEGSWDLFEGQYFTEWDRAKHVIDPYPITDDKEIYFTMDYGLDMLAGYLVAVDAFGAVVFREIYEGKDNGGDGLIVSQAAARIREMCRGFSVRRYFAPPDLWSRGKDSGRNLAELFGKYGVPLTKAPNDRVAGWMQLREWLRPVPTEDGTTAPRLRIFSGCVNLIRTLPALCYDPGNPFDTAVRPHELTHAPDALRYFAASNPRPKREKKAPRRYHFSFQKPRPDPTGMGERIKII